MFTWLLCLLSTAAIFISIMLLDLSFGYVLLCLYFLFFFLLAVVSLQTGRWMNIEV
jgi:hypothetical protein